MKFHSIDSYCYYASSYSLIKLQKYHKSLSDFYREFEYIKQGTLDLESALYPIFFYAAFFCTTLYILPLKVRCIS